jgi:hypothetical protein
MDPPPISLTRRPSQAQARLALARGSSRTLPTSIPFINDIHRNNSNAADSAIPFQRHPHSILLQQYEHAQLAAQMAHQAQLTAINERESSAVHVRAQSAYGHRCVCGAQAAAFAAIAAGRQPPPCTCGTNAHVAAALSPASIAAASSSATAAAMPAETDLNAAGIPRADDSAAATAAVPADRNSRRTGGTSDAFNRSMIWAKSLSRLRSSLLSAYAVYKWALGNSSGGTHNAVGGAGFLTPVELISPLTSDTLMHSSGHVLTSMSSATQLHSLTSIRSGHIFRSIGSSWSKHGASWATLRHAMKLIIWLIRTYSRYFHRLLRPHLILLLRSRSVSRLVGLLFPFLRRNLLLASHAAFVYGSVVILLKRFVPQANASFGLGGESGLVTRTQVILWRVLTKWRAASRVKQLILTFSIASTSFILFTCIQIVREFNRKRYERQAAFKARAAAALQAHEMQMALVEPGTDKSSAISAWSAEQLRAVLFDAATTAASNVEAECHLHHLVDSTPNHSPDPSPPHSPTLTANNSYTDIASMDNYSSSAQSTPYHPTSPSFHRDCSACIAAAIGNTNGINPYRHNHTNSQETGGNNDALDTTVVADPIGVCESALHLLTDSAVYMHPLAKNMATRMEWHPAAAPSIATSSTIDAPGTPLLSTTPVSSLSFVSPASQRLTHIKLSKLIRHEYNSITPQQSTQETRLQQQLQRHRHTHARSFSQQLEGSIQSDDDGTEEEKQLDVPAIVTQSTFTAPITSREEDQSHDESYEQPDSIRGRASRFIPASVRNLFTRERSSV